MSSLPMIFVALAVITVLAPGTGTLSLVIALVSVPGCARLIRTQTLALAGTDFILAERAMGQGQSAFSCPASCPMPLGLRCF